MTFVPISAATMQGVKELPGLVYNRLKDIPPVPVFAPEYKKPEPKANDRAFEIKRMEAHVERGGPVAGIHSGRQQCGRLRKPTVLPASAERERHSGRSGGKKGVQENDTILVAITSSIIAKEEPSPSTLPRCHLSRRAGFTHLKSTCNKSSPFRGSAASGCESERVGEYL